MVRDDTTATSNTPHLLRTANQLLVLNTIMENGSLTVEELVKQTSLSRPTVLEALKRLIADQLVEKAGIARSEVGRQPVLYSVDTHSLFALGVDVDYPVIHIALSDLAQNMVYSDHYELDFDTPADRIAASLLDAVQRALDATGLRADQVIGLGLGLPAAVHIGTNQAVRIDRIPTWENLDIARYLEDATGIKVSVHNDAHMLGLLEQKRLRLGRESFIYVMHRTGIGSALFINGELYDGDFGNSGYIGHMCINADGARCECGNIGCLELYCSRRAILQGYNTAARDAGQPPQRSLGAIYRLGDGGDPIAVRVLAQAGRYLGIGIANIIKLYDIHRVVVGDLHCGEHNPLFVHTVESVRQNTRHFAQKEVLVELSELSGQSGLSGCYYVLNNFLQTPKLRVNLGAPARGEARR